jgi:glycerophosphoryl diester phosphodiesterase
MGFYTGGRGVWIGAHRGASGQAPENTRAAFDLAIAQGADLIECDVQPAADGRLVIHHDFELSRTSGVPGRVGDCDLSALRRLDFGAWRGPSFAGQQILTLEELLAEYSHQTRLNVEIKVEEGSHLAVGAAVAAAVTRLSGEGRVILSTFDLETFLRLRREAPRVPVALLIEAPSAGGQPPQPSPADCAEAGLTVAALHGAAGLHLAHELVTPAIVGRARRLGLPLLAWTVDEPAEARRLAGLGVRAILSNYPADLRSALAGERPRPA